MRRIHKVELMPDTRQVIMMDPESEIVSLGVQYEHPVMWFSTPWPAVNPPVARVFRMMTTGDEYQPEGKVFIGSVTIKGWYVVHVWEQDINMLLSVANGDPIDHRHDEDLIQIRKELDSES